MKLESRPASIVRAARRGAAFALAASLAGAGALAQEPSHDPAGHARASAPPPRRSQPWDPEIVRLAEELPIQEQGRIKPLSTFAIYKLLQLNGARTLSWTEDQGTERKDDDVKHRLTATEWLLDCLFFPEQASTYRCFQLQTSEVADAIHVAHDKKKKRDRYSYDELYPGRDKLDELAQRILHDPRTKEAKNRSAVEEQIVQLAGKCFEFEKLIHLGDFARHGYHLPEEGNLAQIFGGAHEVSMAELLEKGPLLMEARRILTDPASEVEETTRKAKTDAIETLLASGAQMSRLAMGLALFPPAVTAKEQPKWLSLRDLFERRLLTADPLEPLLPAAAALEEAFVARGDMAAMRGAFARLHDSITRLATQRGEGLKVESEVAYHKADLFFLAQWLYVLGFVAIAIGWMARADHRIHRIVPWALTIPLLLHAAAIAWRCYLRARPPVTTLYETILFISGVAVLAAILVEMIDKRRIAVAFAAGIGAFGLFFAARYEAKDAYDSGSDTMPQLQAVLDTNFWLSTHVTTVTIGYAAGLLAALIAHVYVIGKLLGLKKGDPGFYRAVARMTYGVICFGLLFSVVGTILGGIWANYSWGRFWGWDPKENGALMICLWELAILHSRMGGYVKDLGLCTAAIFGGTIVSFSWWHVNLLGVGLHSYGFTHGLLGRLWIYYGIEWLVVLAGLWLWLDDRARRKAIAAAASSARATPAARLPGARRELPGSTP